MTANYFEFTDEPSARAAVLGANYAFPESNSMHFYSLTGDGWGTVFDAWSPTKAMIIHCVNLYDASSVPVLLSPNTVPVPVTPYNVVSE